MIKTDRVVIVEGKYDKIKLENIIDAAIIPTNGFSLFKDKEKKALIIRAAREKGLIVLTDSDNAGNMIRAYLKKICNNADIINVYVPEIIGKERRKAKPSSAGTLGVEGIDDDIILSAFKKSGIDAEKCREAKQKITKKDLYVLGLSGLNNSKKKREELSEYIDLPKNLSGSAFLDAVNTFYSKPQFERLVQEWQAEADKK